MKGKKCIYNLKLAGYLMMNGFPIRRVEKNLDRNWRDVYLFDASDEIEEIIQKYKLEKSKENQYDIGRESNNTP